MKKIWILACALAAAACCEAPQEGTQTRPSEYVTTLMGTQSEFALSTGNTYPAVALPWGMNFWTPQTGRMGNGWTYTYSAGDVDSVKGTIDLIQETIQVLSTENESVGAHEAFYVDSVREKRRQRGQHRHIRRRHVLVLAEVARSARK